MALDHKGHILTINDAMLRRVGYSLQDLMGKSVIDTLVIEEDRTHVLIALQSHRHGKPVNTQETRIRARNGAIVIIAWDATLLRGLNGVVEQFLIIGTDVTARRRAEEALLEANQRLQDIIDFLPDATMVVNYEKRVIAWNRALEEMTGASKAQMMGQGEHAYSVPFYGERKPILLDLIWDETRVNEIAYDYVKITGHNLFAETYLSKLFNGRGAYVWITAAPLFDANGNIVGAIESVRDITARKKAEEEARLRQEQLIQADKMVSLGILVAGVAHEINNPNFAIMQGASSLTHFWRDLDPVLERYREDHGNFEAGGITFDEMRAYIPELLAAVSHSADRIKYIVQELRDFARQNPATFNETVSLNAVVASSITLLANMIKKTTSRFTVNYADDIPPARGNYRRLEQVVINLIQNACQAISDPSKAIAVTTFYDDKASIVGFEVFDEGIGIDPESMTRILDPFFTTKRDSGGTGLGLSIASTIIREHGGSLVFDSEPGAGTTAKVTLPMEQASLTLKSI